MKTDSPNRNYRKNRSAGFSLVEVIVASVMFLVIAVGILPMFTRSIISNETSHESSEVSNFGRDLIEEYGPLTFNSPELDIPAGDEQVLYDHFSENEHRWKGQTTTPAGHVPAGGDKALYLRTITIRQFHVTALDDGEIADSERLVGNADPANVHLKQVLVNIVSGRGGSLLGPEQEIGLQLLKSQ